MISPNEHPWVSDACEHAVHSDCPGVCKYCSAPCVCGCHAQVRAAVATPPAPPRGQRFARTDPAQPTPTGAAR